MVVQFIGLDANPAGGGGGGCKTKTPEAKFPVHFRKYVSIQKESR